MNKRANSHFEFLFNRKLLNSKRSQSQIITTILIILLVLAAIVIVWQVVQSTIESGAETIEGTAACIGIDLKIVSAYATGNNVTVTRMSGGNMNAVANVKFLVAGSSIADTAVSVALPATTKNLEPLETKTYTGVTSSVGEKVEVAAILSDTDGTICNVMDNALAE